MSGAVRRALAGAAGDLRSSWRSLALTDLAYKLVAFALLTPGTALLMRWVRSGSSAADVVADTDILWFFVTTRIGVLTLVLGGSLVLTITAVEAACLMGIAFAAASGSRLDARSALAFGARRAQNVLRLTLNMVVRVLAGVVPFLVAFGVVYVALLRDYDINFYLAERPSEFWIAAAIVAVLALGLVALILHTVARWVFALPIVLFEDVLPFRALGESARRSKGKRGIVLAALGGWAVFSLVLLAAASAIPEALGRATAPHFAGSLAVLLTFITGLGALWVALAFAAGIVNFSLFATIVTRLYLQIGDPHRPTGPSTLPRAAREARRLSGRATLGIAAVLVLAVTGAVLLTAVATHTKRPVLVIAHRGASAAAPENTLAAFRLAADQGTDLVELDVQESRDGEVVVVHDSDLMKVGKSPLKIWDTDAAMLREVDIGRGERVPTLAEALAACQGRSQVLVELKSYGHAQRLEERVAEIVESAGMEQDCVFMSLDHEMVRKMKRLRPAWRSGVLAAKAFGDLTKLDADFLAVESKLATRRFVRRAHRAGKDVYVWTVNEPASMIRAIAHGVDGLITDKPDLARLVLTRREEMSEAQRLLVALLVRLGVSTETLEAGALRP